MSDGMSDSRPHSAEHETWTEVDEVKLPEPADVHFYHFRDGIQGECGRYDVIFFISFWGRTKVVLPTGDEAIAFPAVDKPEETARKVMKEAIKARLKQGP